MIYFYSQLFAYPISLYFLCKYNKESLHDHKDFLTISLCSVVVSITWPFVLFFLFSGLFQKFLLKKWGNSEKKCCSHDKH